MQPNKHMNRINSTNKGNFQRFNQTFSTLNLDRLKILSGMRAVTDFSLIWKFLEFVIFHAKK